MSVEDQVTQTLLGKDWIEDCSADIPDLATAFDVQDGATARVAAEHGGFAGYKIAFNTKALMDRLNMFHPGMGRIFADQVYDSGVQLDADNYTNFMIEPEIAAVLKSDLVPGLKYSPKQAEAAVDRYFPAFELLDRRNKDGVMHPPTVIAHNVFNAGIVIGGPGLTPAELNAADIVTNCRDNGKVVVEGQGISPQEPAEALAFLANHFCGRGQVMPAGSLVLLGAHCPLYAVGNGREMTLDLGAMGHVSFST